MAMGTRVTAQICWSCQRSCSTSCASFMVSGFCLYLRPRSKTLSSPALKMPAKPFICSLIASKSGSESVFSVSR